MAPSHDKHWPTPLRNAILLALIVAGGLWLRLEGWPLPLCHFAEGIYASSVAAVLDGGLWELDYALPYHSPPLYVWLTASLSAVKGPAVNDGVLVSAVCGSLTAVAVFLLGWRVAGPGLGLTAAALTAASDLHVAVSRTGWPEATFTLWLTLAFWAAAELAPRPLQGGIPRLPHIVFFALLAGALLSCSVLTMYGGLLAIAALAIAFCWASIRGNRDVEGRIPYLFTAICLAAAAALAVFAAWYWHLQPLYEGGVWSVLREVAYSEIQVTRWPANLMRMFASLPALRHGGWVATTAIVAVGGATLAWQAEGWRRAAGLAAAVAGLAAAVIAGGDVVLLTMGVAGVVPALLSRRWPRLLCAVWLATTLLSAPACGPSVRQLAPALPPAALLSLALVWPPARSGRTQQRSRDSADESDAGDAAPWPALPWVAGGLLACAGAALLSPMPPTPSAEMWNRWYGGSGYAEFARRVAAETPASAAVICQGQPTLAAYCPRSWKAHFGDVSFLRGLEGLESDHPAFLALDFRYVADPKQRGASSQDAGDARAAVLQWLHCLEPAAVVPFQPTTLMLLDHLPPPLANLKIHAPPTPSRWTDRNGRSIPVPPDIRTSGEDIIVLYRIDLPRLRQELSKELGDEAP